FANVKTIPQTEINSYPTGDWYWPPDGTMVLIHGDPTVYVMDHQVRRPVTFFVFNQRHLSFTKVVTVSTDELLHIPQAPDSYWLAPIDGTLVKSSDSPAIYLIANGQKQLLSFEAFTARGF